MFPNFNRNAKSFSGRERGDGKGFTPLAYDTTPGYVDTQPFPATPVKWTYQAIYRVGDSRVGQRSKPASVTVGG
jgi:hypothetical protein